MKSLICITLLLFLSPTLRALTTGNLAIVENGTYNITICKKDCHSDTHPVHGVLVLDRTPMAFVNTNEAMKYLMRADSAMFTPNYCYIFDPETSSAKGTLLEHDPVSFGMSRISAQDGQTLVFNLQSPDFFLISKIRSANFNSFVGSWMSWYAGDGGVKTEHNEYQLTGTKTAAANAELCFAAVRKFRRRELTDYCSEFPARTCEPGDRPHVP